MTDDRLMFDSTSGPTLMQWIEEWVIVQGVDAPWVTNPRVPIAKSSLNFVTKFWWSVVRVRLHPTGNDKMVQLSNTSLIARLMSKYGINVGWIIATKMWDWALSDRADMPYLCLIWALCCLGYIPTTRYLDGRITPKGVVNITLIKNVTNPLFRVRTRTLGGLIAFPQTPPQQPLPVEDYATVPPSRGASEQPGCSGTKPLVQQGYVNVPYESLAQIVTELRQICVIMDKIVKRMPHVVHSHVQ